MNIFSEKLKNFFGGKTELNEEFFENLADLLIEGDFGAALAMETVETLEKLCKKEKEKTQEGAKKYLTQLLKEYLSPVYENIEAPSLSSGFLTVILLLGVNGVGKTTSAAKLAALYKNSGKPILAAADTFRAAAIEQLEQHGGRLALRVVAHKKGGDAAAVLFDTLQAAAAGDYNPVIADTAGRMHTKQALVEELKKIDRVVERFRAASGKKLSYLKYLCLDFTTGTNALNQAEVFNEAVRLDGVILTKADSTAKGGIVFPLARKLKLPVVFLCSGEKYTDIKPFNAGDFVDEFLGRR